MNLPSTIVLAALLLAQPDTPHVYRLRSPSPADAAIPAPLDLGSLPDLFLRAVPHGSSKNDLRPESRLEIVRYVDGEFAHAVKPLPGGKKGFRMRAGAPFDEKGLKQALANDGAIANAGDTVQITAIEFKEKEIVLEINGGTRKHGHWRDHVSVGIGNGPMSAGTSAPAPRQGTPRGTVLILDYGRPLPDMSADDLKQDLAGLLDFSKERSAAVQWVDTLPPEYKKAIQDRRAAIGMDHEMVIAAMGRPDHKVRERDANGDETEDWIYGTPPAKTVFVTFSGDKVVRVKQFP
jgi:hypothetical protein